MKKRIFLSMIMALTIGASSLVADINKTFDPFEDMHQIRQHMIKMQEEMDKIFGNFHQKMKMDSRFGDFEPFKNSFFNIEPAVDLKDKGDHYEVKANIPGADNQKIDVSIKDGILKISATTSKSHEEKKGDKFLKQERYMGSYMRMISLPEDADGDTIKNSYKDGVLTVTIKKKNKIK